MSHRTLTVTDDQRAELADLIHHAPKPYLRERAAAMLKIADGAIPIPSMPGWIASSRTGSLGS